MVAQDQIRSAAEAGVKNANRLQSDDFERKPASRTSLLILGAAILIAAFFGGTALQDQPATAADVEATGVASAAGSADHNWPQWRGPLLTGVAPKGSPPVEWSESKNVKWKQKLPGKGSSTPIIWGNQIFIQTAISTGKKPDADAKSSDESAADKGAADKGAADKGAATKADAEKGTSAKEPSGKDSEKSAEKGAEKGAGEGAEKGAGETKRPPRGGGGFGGGFGRGRGAKPTEIHQFVLLCLDRKTGKTLWQKIAREELPHEGHHQDHGFSSSSPVTDGQYVIAYFGSRGLHCYDMQGNLKWQKDLGRMRTANTFGEGSSPALHGNTVVVNWDHEGEDFIAAFNRETSEEIWRQPRDEATTWSTPLIVEHGGKAQVVTAATKRVRSYDLVTGKMIWDCTGLTRNTIPTPVAADGMVYATAGYSGSALLAIRLGGTGDLTGTDSIVWSHRKSTPYVPSPLLHDNRLYFFASNNAILSCFNAKSGEPLIEAERLDGMQGVYASPVAADGRIYLVGRNGTSLVLKQSDTVDILATNRLDDRIDASPAIVGKELFLRGHEYLYCIAED